MSRAFFICPEPVRQITAGVGSRFLALAGVLADAGHQVTVAIPNDPEEAGRDLRGVELIQADSDRLGQQADHHDWVFLHAHLGNHYLCQRDDQPVVIDLYDPFMIENLHYHRDLGFAPFTTDHATWRLQMARGDFFLCSSEEQRLYYLGWLSALGRVNPLSVDDDPRLERLIRQLPFGTPDGDIPSENTRTRILPDVPAFAKVLYFGGIYDWYDPFVLLDALPLILEQHPETVVVFVEHPHPDLTPLSVEARVKAQAEKNGWLGKNVRFVPWQPFERRFDVPVAADLAVVTHQPGIETDLSLRTRLVDLLWLGLPVVATSGGTMAHVINDLDAGLVVPAGDVDALTRAVNELLNDQDRLTRMGHAGRRWAEGRSWAEVAKPLLEYAANPWKDRHRQRFDVLQTPAVAADEPLINRLKRKLRRFGS